MFFRQTKPRLQCLTKLHNTHLVKTEHNTLAQTSDSKDHLSVYQSILKSNVKLSEIIREPKRYYIMQQLFHKHWKIYNRKQSRFCNGPLKIFTPT